jgi:hypothetical protein
VLLDLLPPGSELWKKAVLGLLTREKELVVDQLVSRFSEMPEDARFFLYYQLGLLGWPELRSYAEIDKESGAPILFPNSPPFATLGGYARIYLWHLDHPEWRTALEKVLRRMKQDGELKD